MLLQGSESRMHTGSHVGMTRVKTDLQIQPGIVNEVQQTLGCAELVGSVFEQDLDPAFLGKDLQIFKRREGGVKLAQVILLVLQPKMQYQIAKRKPFGDLQGALHL